MFVNHKSSTGLLNKSYAHENNNKLMQKPKIQEKNARGKCRSHLNHERLSENFIYEQLSVSYEPLRTINIG